MRPKSQIYTPKRDDEHPRPFHMGVPPLGFSSAKREACTCFPPLSTNCTNPIFPRYKKKKNSNKKNVHSYKYKSLKENFLLEQYLKSHTVFFCTFYFKHFPAHTALAFSSMACMVTLFIQGISFRYIYIQVQKN